MIEIIAVALFDNGFDWNWIGLLGLLGLIPRKPFVERNPPDMNRGGR